MNSPEYIAEQGFDMRVQEGPATLRAVQGGDPQYQPQDISIHRRHNGPTS